MFYNRGDLIIGTFIPSHVGKIDPSQKEVTVTCASWKKSDGSPPDDEVNIIKNMVAHGYDNSNVIQAGTVLQSYNPDDIVLISDGFESFLGVVTDVIDPHDQHRDEVIIYQIKIARYLPPKEPVDAEMLPGGDEDTWDDDWELGYEKYGTSGSGGCQIGSDGLYGGGYGVGQYYDELNMYSHNQIEGAAYNPQFGYLLPGSNRHIMPYNLNGYTSVFNLGQIYQQVILLVGYGGAGTPVIGEFGEVTYIPSVSVPDAIMNVNGVNYKIPFVAGEDLNSVPMQSVAVNINSDHLVISVDSAFPVFTIQSIAFVASGSEITSSECISTSGSGGSKIDNKLPEYVDPAVYGGGIAGGGGTKQNVKLLTGSSGSGGGLGG